MTYNFHHWPFVAGVFSTPIPFILFILSNLCVLAPLREINQKSLFITIFPFKAFQSISKRFKAIQRFLHASFFIFIRHHQNHPILHLRLASLAGKGGRPTLLQFCKSHLSYFVPSVGHTWTQHRQAASWPIAGQLPPNSFLSLIPWHARLTYGIYSIRPCADRPGRG